MRDPAPLVPDVAPPALVDREARRWCARGGRAARGATPAGPPPRGARVRAGARAASDAQRAHGVGEERVRAVERVDEAAAVGGARPAPGLHRPARLERQLAEVPLAALGLVAPLEREAPQRAPGAHVVEAVVVHPHVGHVGGHARVGALAAELEEARARRWRRTAGAPSRTGSPASSRSSRARCSGPRTVKTGEPSAGFQPFSRARIFSAESAHIRAMAGSQVGGPQRLVDPDHRGGPRGRSPPTWRDPRRRGS